MNHRRSTQAEEIAAILQQAAHAGRPVLIPGALEVRVGRPDVKADAATVGPSAWRAAGAAGPDRGRLEREREGGGAPSERTGGRPRSIVARLWRRA